MHGNVRTAQNLSPYVWPVSVPYGLVAPLFPLKKGPALPDTAQNDLSAEEFQSRARGCLLGQMVGDALGAAVEGYSQEEIRSLSRRTWGTDLVQGFLEAVPMGTFCHAGEPGM